MNSLKFKYQVSELAKDLLNKAKSNEPAITQFLKSIATDNNAKLAGLENKFKTLKSLTRKLMDSVETRENQSLERQSKKIDDSLRYTIILQPDEYKTGYQSILSLIEGKEFRIQNIWNAWGMERTTDDTGYRGINVTIISSQNQKFELQFHTEESFRLKTETHNFYEERRNPKISRKRFAELIKIGKENAATVKLPKGM